MTSPKLLFLSLTGEPSTHLIRALHDIDVAISEAQSLVSARTELQTGNYQICVMRCDSIEDNRDNLLRFIKDHQPNIITIVSSQRGSIEDAVCSIRHGAIDFIVGSYSDARLTESILKTLTKYRDALPTLNNQKLSSDNEQPCVLVGRSPAISEIRSAVNLVAKSQTTVLITGESGTGKEVVARLIHQQSNRAEKRFVALNCATFPRDVIENELFGHEKGAFTGALLKKQGCFELADKGTLLFDEIAEMSLETQAKLLRAIETQKFRRLGGREEIKVDIRMIAATNKNISIALKTKELREDLYYRLSVIEIYLPPVREHKEDIPLLVEYFMSSSRSKYDKQQQRFTDEALELLNDYDWPGNVREIRNIIERAVVICPHDYIGPRYLPDRIRQQVPTRTLINIPLGSSSQEAEKILILQTLASVGNNKSKTARILGLSRKTLHNKLAGFSNS